MTTITDDIIYYYNRIKSGESVWLNSSGMESIDEYALSIHDEFFLNNMISEHIGNGVYRCFIIN